MNNDSYVECLVKVKQSPIAKFFLILLTIFTTLFGLATFLFMMPVMLILAVICGVGVYFLNMRTNLEFEYLYLDRELSVDKIMNKAKRKRVVSYSVDRMEILAPIKSYHLDDYKNRDAKTVDYSIREELQPDRRYVLYYEGGVKVILSPSEEIVKAIKNVAPRKVFTD